MPASHKLNLAQSLKVYAANMAKTPRELIPFKKAPKQNG